MELTAPKQKEAVKQIFIKSKLPDRPASLTLRCATPQLTGDKGQDAIIHRAGIACRDDKLKGWELFYGDVLNNFSR